MRNLLRRLTESAVYRSIFRHGFPDTNRNRSLAVFTNFFLHIHPVKVRRRAIEFRRTYFLGGLSAACFFILVVTGVLLMLYYRPSAPDAYHDMKDLAVRGRGRGVPAEPAPLVGARDGRARPRAHGGDVLSRRLPAAARVQLGDRRAPAGRHRAALVHGLPAPLGSARVLGGHRRHEHGRGGAGHRGQAEAAPARRPHHQRRRAAALLRPPLRRARPSR